MTQTMRQNASQQLCWWHKKGGLHKRCLAAIKRNIYRPDKRLDRNLMKFNRDKCKLLPLGLKILCKSTIWEQTGWKAPYQKMPWRSWRTPEWPSDSNVALCQMPMTSWALKRILLPAGQGKWYLPSSQKF